MQRARHETPLPPPVPPVPQEYDDEPEYGSRRRRIPCTATRPSRRSTRPSSRSTRHAAAAPAQDYDEAPQQYADEPQQDPSRYDDALYGRIETGEHDYQRDPAYPDDPYAYQGEYEEEPAPKKRSSGLMTVAAVLALAVVGTGAAFAYRTFVGSPRSGEPPIIRADNSPTKVVPAPSDASAAKNPDRMLSGDGGEKLVSREETPVDVNSRSGGPRVVFPPLNQNANPPPACECISVGADACGRQRHDAEQRAAQDQDARRQGRRRRQRRHPGRRQCAAAEAGAADANRRCPGRRLPLPRRRVTRPQPMPAPIRRCRSRRRRPNRSRRPAWLRLIRPKPRRLELPRVGAVFWFGDVAGQRVRGQGVVPVAAGQVRVSAGFPVAGDQAGGSG